MDKSKIKYISASVEKEMEFIKKIAESDFNKEVMRLLKEYDENKEGEDEGN